jgi:hypothetical protein
MKFKIVTFGESPNKVSCSNTPTGCVVYDSDGNIVFDGLNLTDEGEFVPAPGFGRERVIVSGETVEEAIKLMTGDYESGRLVYNNFNDREVMARLTSAINTLRAALEAK